MVENYNFQDHSLRFIRGYLTVFLLSLILTSNLSAQLDGQSWFIGDEASNSGIVFSSDLNQPSPNNTKGPIDLSESSVMLASSSGVNFYSNGKTILNELNQPMANGRDLKGSPRSMYGSSLVANPAACDQYYLFYTESTDQGPNRKLYYSIIDMTIMVAAPNFSSLGDVLIDQKDVDITPLGVDIGESLYSIDKPIPKEGSWLLASDRNKQAVLIFNISASGISLHKEYKIDQITRGASNTQFSTIKFEAQKIENERTFIALAPSSEEGYTGFQISGFNFNLQNGELEVESYVEIASTTTSTYGAAFSADGSKFYYSDHIDKTLHQYDFTSSTTTLIGTSAHNGKSGGLKRTINDEIYWANIFSRASDNSKIESLSVIKQPNQFGTTCDLSLDSYKLNSSALPVKLGIFPCVVTKALAPSAFMINESSCGRNNGNVGVLVDPKLEPLTYNWSDGSTEKELRNVSSGTYSVEIQSLDGCIFMDSIEVTESSSFSIPNITVSYIEPSDCNSDDGQIIISSPNLLIDDLYEFAYSFNQRSHFTTLVEANENKQLIIRNLPVGFYNNLALLRSTQNCSISIDDEISLLGMGVAPDLGIDTVICDRENYLIQPRNNYATYLWSDGSDDSSLSVNETGIYSLETNDANGCTGSNSVFVQFAESPKVTLTQTINLNVGDSIVLMPEIISSDPLTYKWTPPEGLSCFDCLRPTARPSVSQAYLLEVTNDSNCKDFASVNIITNNKSALYFPNAFTPNGDGQNDLFEFSIASDAVDLIKSFSIFNRWGESIFLRENIEPGEVNFGWDGNQKGIPAENGVYIYTAEVALFNGEIVYYTGDVLIVR